MLGGGEARASQAGLPGLQGALIAGRGHHAQRGVPAVVVVVLDPGADLGPGRRPGRVVLDAPELELQGGVPGFDDRVIQRRQLRPIPLLRSESCG